MKAEFVIGLGIALLAFALSQGYNIMPIVGIAGLGAILFFGYAKRETLGGKLQVASASSVPSVRFEDIGGQAVAKRELEEALKFVQDGEQARSLGIRPLKGVLLSGPPGTGKTLLAKAAANLCDAAFVASSGSEFIEMYAGVGAQRIRKLFKQARDKARREGKATAVIFIDELEILGGVRGKTSSHMEYDQTLNQLLVELDGIRVNEEVRILLIGATNRKDMLDSALLRPGRFDRIVEVDLPEKAGRLEILRLHTRNKPLSADVILEKLAEETYGYSGAHLESMCNEAAILALRDSQSQIRFRHFAEAMDKVMMGEKLVRDITIDERERIAVHEAGHALVCEIQRPGHVASVKLTSRGKALGYMRQTEVNQQFLYTREQLCEQMRIALGGSAAEQVLCGNVSTGATSDFEKACQIGEMIVKSGMSELGIISEKIGESEVAKQVARIVNVEFDYACEILRQNADSLQAITAELLKIEVIEGDDLRRMLVS